MSEAVKTVNIRLCDAAGKELDSFQMRYGTNLWVFLRKRGQPIGAACSGVGVCGACNVRIEPADEKSVSAQTDFERQNLERNGKSASDRLACLCRVYADVSVQAEYW